MKKLRVAYISESSPFDKHSWSGTNYYIYKALQDNGCAIDSLGPYTPKLLSIPFKIINELSKRLFNKRFDYRHFKSYSKVFGKHFSNKINKGSYDIAFVCGGSEFCAYLNISIPYYLVVDRVIAGTLNYHTILSNLWLFSERSSIQTDKRAMSLAKLVVFSSEWASLQAKEFYHLPDEKRLVIPFGANMDLLPDRNRVLQTKTLDTIRLLFIGTNWKNKGGPIVYNCYRILKNKGLNVKLTIVGSVPDTDTEIESDVTVIPFVNKNSQEGLLKMEELFLAHHFFILPTRFDCTPIVFCEASAFGLPVLSSDTGGVKGHIKEGINGYTLDFNDKGEQYAEKIMAIINSGNYAELSKSARIYYEETLNWNHWADTTLHAIYQSLESTENTLEK